MNEQLSQAVSARLGPFIFEDTDVAQLAALACTPPFVPFPLLRDLRIHGLPGSVLGLEARLCESDIVESIASDGFVLYVRTRAALRRALRGAVVEDGLEIDLTMLRSAMSPGLEYLSPLLQLEERIAWTYATTEDFLPLAEEELAAVVHSVVRERRLRMLEWASGAMMRLPEEVLQTPSAWLLSQLCQAVGLPHPDLAWPAGDVDRAMFREAMALIPQTIIGIARDGTNLFVGPVSRERPIGIRVPATAPATVRVVWEAQLGGLELNGVDRTVQTIPSGRSAIELIGLDGRVVRLAELTGDIPAEVAELSQVFDRLEVAYNTRQTMRADVLPLSVGEAGCLVRLLDEPTVRAFLPSRFSALPRLPEGALGDVLTGAILVQIQRIDRETQAVTVRRVRSIRSRGTLRVGQRCTGRVVAKLQHGILVSLNEAAGLSQPDFEPLIGVIYTQSLLPLQDWVTGLRSARSYPVDIGDEINVQVKSIETGNRRIKLIMADRGDASHLSLPDDVRVGDRFVGTAKKFYHGIRFSLVERADTSADRGPVPGGLSGVVVNTELSWEGRWYFGGGDARDYPLQVGDRSEVLVTGFNRATGDVSLSIKRLVDDPGQAALKQLRAGTEVYGVVVRRRGARWRVRLEPWSVTADVTEGRDFQGQLRNGVRVYLRIEEIDTIRRKIRASLQRVVSPPEGAADDDEASPSG